MDEQYEECDIDMMSDYDTENIDLSNFKLSEQKKFNDQEELMDQYELIIIRYILFPFIMLYGIENKNKYDGPSLPSNQLIVNHLQEIITRYPNNQLEGKIQNMINASKNKMTIIHI